MKLVIQRVKRASVKVNDGLVGEIGQGLLLLVGIGVNDNATVFRPTAEKVFQMRIFENEQGRFDKSLKDVNGEILLVPQFTLFADTSKGRRPEFFGAMRPEKAAPFFNEFVEEFRKLGVKKVATGEFGANMLVELANDGPVTIQLEA